MKSFSKTLFEPTAAPHKTSASPRREGEACWRANLASFQNCQQLQGFLRRCEGLGCRVLGFRMRSLRISFFYSSSSFRGFLAQGVKVSSGTLRGVGSSFFLPTSFGGLHVPSGSLSGLGLRTSGVSPKTNCSRSEKHTKP